MLSFEVKKTMVAGLFEGLSVMEIWRKVRRMHKKLSHSSVSRAIEEFILEVEEEAIEGSETEEEAIMQVATKYGVREQVSELVDIAKIKKTTDAQSSDMISGAKISQTLKKLGVNPSDHEQLSAFVNSLYKESMQKGISIPEMMDWIRYFQQLGHKYNANLPTLVDKFRKADENLPRLSEQTLEAQSKISELQIKHAELFNKFNSDKTRLEKCEQIRLNLEKFGIDLERIEEPTENFLKLIDDNRLGPKQLFERIKYMTDLDEEKEKLHSSIKQLKDEKIILGEDNQNLDRQAEQLRDQIQEANNVFEIGVTVPQIQKLRSTIVEIASKNGFSSREAWSNFEKDVEDNYDPMLGLRPVILGLENTKSEMEENIRALKEQMEKDKLATAKELDRIIKEKEARQEEVTAYSKLRAKGITDEVLKRWGRISEQTNLPGEVIESELIEQRSLVSKANEVKKVVIELTKNRDDLQARKEALESDVRRLGGTLKELNGIIVRSAKQTSDQVVAHLSRVTLPLEKLAAAEESVRRFGRYESLLPILKLTLGDDVPASELRIAMRILQEIYKQWLEKHPTGNSEIKQAVEIILDNLRS